MNFVGIQKEIEYSAEIDNSFAGILQEINWMQQKMNFACIKKEIEYSAEIDNSFTGILQEINSTRKQLPELDKKTFCGYIQ